LNKRIVILGSGESGVGSAILAQSKGFAVFVSDKGSIQEKYNIAILSKARGKSYTISCSFNKLNSNYLIDCIVITENNNEQHEELCEKIREIGIDKLKKKMGGTPTEMTPMPLNDPFRNQDIKRHNQQMKQNQLDHIQRVQRPPFPR
jgi:hypothetical protein